MARAEAIRLPASIVAALGILAAPAAATAQGCGPTRLKVMESVELPVPPDRVWSLIGNFQDMRWDRALSTTTGQGGNVPDQAVRTLTLRDGAKVGESLYRYDAEARSYSYHMDTIDVVRLPVQNVSATLEVLPAADGAASIVRWRGAFYRYLAPGEGPPDIADAAASRAMAGYLREGLAGLKAALDART